MFGDMVPKVGPSFPLPRDRRVKDFSPTSITIGRFKLKSPMHAVTSQATRKARNRGVSGLRSLRNEASKAKTFEFACLDSYFYVTRRVITLISTQLLLAVLTHLWLRDFTLDCSSWRKLGPTLLSRKALPAASGARSGSMRYGPVTFPDWISRFGETCALRRKLISEL
jgi:hypothetical protein